MPESVSEVRARRIKGQPMVLPAMVMGVAWRWKGLFGDGEAWARLNGDAQGKVVCCRGDPVVGVELLDQGCRLSGECVGLGRRGELGCQTWGYRGWKQGGVCVAAVGEEKGDGKEDIIRFGLGLGTN